MTSSSPTPPTPFFPSPSLSLAHAGSAGGLEEEGGHHFSKAPHPHVRMGNQEKALIKMTSHHRRRRRDSAPSWLESVLGGGRLKEQRGSADQCSAVWWSCGGVHTYIPDAFSWAPSLREWWLCRQRGPYLIPLAGTAQRQCDP